MISGLNPDLVVGFVLLDIVVILVAARAFGALALRVGQPRVVGEIVAGVALGPSLLGATIFTWDNAPGFLHCDASRSFLPVGVDPATFVAPAASITQCLFPVQARGVLSILGQIALIFFMFLVGLELHLGSVRRQLKGVMAVASGVVLAPLAGALLIGPLLHDPKFALADAEGSLPGGLGFSLFVAAMLAVTAFPVMARILQENGLMTSTMGVIGVAAAAVVTVAMFLLLAVAKGVSSGSSTGELVTVFAAAAVYLVVMAGPVRLALARLEGRLRSVGTVDGPMFALFMIVAFASAYAADRIGIHVIVGGFLAGAVMPAHDVVHRPVADRLGELTGTVLLPIFLAFSGLRTDFTTVRFEHLAGIVAVLVVGVAVKWAAGAASARAVGLTWAEGNVLGALMNCRGLLVLVVGIVAVDAGVFTPQMQIAGVVMALVTTAMTGPLVRRFAPRLEPATVA